MKHYTSPAEIDQILADTRKVLDTVRRHQQEDLIILIVGLIVFVLLMVYVYRRWTWIPRKRQRTHFTEKF